MKDETNYRANDQMEIGKKRRVTRSTKQTKKERKKQNETKQLEPART